MPYRRLRKLVWLASGIGWLLYDFSVIFSSRLMLTAMNPDQWDMVNLAGLVGIGAWAHSLARKFRKQLANWMAQNKDSILTNG